jgi:hypothetical protein
MPNFFTELATRISIDYKEWRDEIIIRWNTKREMKQIDSAIRRAKKRNLRDHRTYYIIKDRRGAINALTKQEIDKWSDKKTAKGVKTGLFPRMTINQVYHSCIDMVTCTRRDMDQFNRIKSTRKPIK